MGRPGPRDGDDCRRSRTHNGSGPDRWGPPWLGISNAASSKAFPETIRSSCKAAPKLTNFVDELSQGMPKVTQTWTMSPNAWPASPTGGEICDRLGQHRQAHHSLRHILTDGLRCSLVDFWAAGFRLPFWSRASSAAPSDNFTNDRKSGPRGNEGISKNTNLLVLLTRRLALERIFFCETLVRARHLFVFASQEVSSRPPVAHIPCRSPSVVQLPGVFPGLSGSTWLHRQLRQRSLRPQAALSAPGPQQSSPPSLWAPLFAFRGSWPVAGAASSFVIARVHNRPTSSPASVVDNRRRPRRVADVGRCHPHV